MSYFDPTPAEMKFRVTVSSLVFAALLGTLVLRGLPEESLIAQGIVLALVFLGLSALVSVARLKKFEED